MKNYAKSLERTATVALGQYRKQTHQLDGSKALQLTDNKGSRSQPNNKEWVETVLAMDQPEIFPQMIGVLDTEDNFALAMATTALRDAGIIFDLVAIPAVQGAIAAERPKWWTPPCRILVAVEDEGEARSLLEPYQQPATPEEIDRFSK